MTKKEFIVELKKENYKLNPVGYWEQLGNRILIHVYSKNFSRVIKFDSGSLGHIETLSFDKIHVLKWRS